MSYHIYLVVFYLQRKMYKCKKMLLKVQHLKLTLFSTIYNTHLKFKPLLKIAWTPTIGLSEYIDDYLEPGKIA